MRVLQIIDSLPTGGGARFVVNSVPLFNEMGVDTDVLLLDGTETSFYDELEKTRSCKIISLTKGKRWDPRNIFRIIPYLKQYDLVHVHIFPGSYFVALAKFFSRRSAPIVFTEHNSQNRRAVHFIFRNIENFVYAQFKKIVCLTTTVEKFVLNNLNVSSAKLEVIENGVDIKKIINTKGYKKKEFGYTESQKLILMSARFELQKDHETVIKALSSLSKEFFLLLAGEGSKLNFYKKMVHDLQLEDRVTFLGNRKDIFEIMKMCDFNVLSSHFEGLSLSAIEGLASGKPFIASDVAGLDFIKNAGILFPKGDYDGLAKILEELSNDEVLYNKTVKNCLEKAYQYDIKNMMEKYITLYHNLVQDNKSSLS